MKHIIRSVVITNEYTRYGGDHDCTLALVVTRDMNCYLWFTGMNVKIQHITSHPEYIEWLFHWNEALLELEKEYWWNDRTGDRGRYEEFHDLLKYEGVLKNV